MPKARRKAVADTPGRATESFRYTSNGEPAAAESEAAAAPELDYDEAAKKQQRQQQQHVVPPAAAEAEAAPAAEAAAAKAQGKGKGKGKAAVRTKAGHQGESDTHKAAPPPPPYPEVPYAPSKQRALRRACHRRAPALVCAPPQLRPPSARRCFGSPTAQLLLRVDSLAQLAADILANEERGLAERCPQGSAGKEIRAALRVIKGVSDITRDRLIEVAKSVQGLVPVDMDVDEQRTRLQEVRKLIGLYQSPVDMDVDEHRMRLQEVRKLIGLYQEVRKLIGLYQEEERQLDAEEALLERRMAHPPPQPSAQDEGEDRNLQVMLQSLSGEDLEQQLHQVLEDIGQEAADICSNLASIRDTCEEAHDTQRQLYAHFEQWRYPSQGNARDAIRGMTQ
ncbi:hypothetical protein JKP88DRAFT_353737 [Tribonema minus]|uniref:Uncharacterized protein n=1 Tax=Tribonema minus TaxID=303371 RepID=A0A836CJ61_9STRA|nr:hypothetical protein JKP88DRAFT_353737 [Tribonema minus]